MEHWHLYMDESGSFEGEISEVRRRRLSMLFLLVSDGEKYELEEELQSVYRKYFSSGSYPHAMEHIHSEEFYLCIKDVITILRNYHIKLFYFQHKDDVYQDNTNILSDEYLANRYLNMFLDGLEYITFLDISTWGRDFQYSFFPCSRVTPIDLDDIEKKNEYEQSGYTLFLPDNNPTKYLVILMDTTSLRSYLYKMLREYNIFYPKIGRREYSAIESIAAYKSKDVFVHLVDNLVMILRIGSFNKRFQEFKKEIEDLITDVVEYNTNHYMYKNIMFTYLNGNQINALTEIIRQKGQLNAKYIRRSFDRLISMLFTQDKLTLAELVTLESAIDNDLRSSRGNWDYISTVLDCFDNFVKKLSATETKSEQFQRLLKRMYSHRLSIHNHRGEVLSAWQVLQKIDEISDQSLGFEEWREEIEIHNRAAVASANMFEFEKSNLALEQALKLLQETKEKIQSVTQKEIKDHILGKVLGTLGQNYGFLAPLKPEFFAKAEDCFVRAKAEFVKEMDRQRQDMYLLHLYYDWQKVDDTVFQKEETLLKQLVANPDVQNFLNNPSPENAKYKQFILQIILKYHLEADISIVKQLCEQFTLSRLKQLFEDAADEHPFEFIYSYLGLMCMRCNNLEDAGRYFDYAIRIPLKGRRIQQPTLQAIRSQILARYALELYRKNEKIGACQKMQDAVKIMEQLGNHPDYKPILSLQDGQAVDGWFKDAWNRMLKVDWTNDFNEDACKTFLKYFTFNYA
jgi:hypothetical protein